MNKILLLLLIIMLPSTISAEETGSCYKEQRWYTETILATINTALHFFKLDVGRYPTMEEGFDILVEGNKLEKPNGYSPIGYLNKKASGARDPWGSPYQYSLEPSHHFYSLGKDKKIGGVGEDEDIHVFFKDHLVPRPKPSCNENRKGI